MELSAAAASSCALRNQGEGVLSMICKDFAPCAGLYTCTCSCGPLRARERLERVDREELIGASARRLKDVVVVRNCTGSALTAPATFLSGVCQQTACMLVLS
jgi:hypothetical protein